MNINLHNYEAYFLDYHEGTLSVEQVEELMDFLDRHPELKEEFESFEAVTLNAPQKITYEEKQTLKKQLGEITSSNFDEYAIGYVEKTLSTEKQKELLAFADHNPHFKKELELYKKTKLTPDSTILFDNKSSLKRKEGSRQVPWYWSAAASVALLIGAYFMFNKSEVPGKNNLAVQHTLKKDSTLVANKSVNAKDTTASVKNAGAAPLVKRIKNNSQVAFKTQRVKQNKAANGIPFSYKDSSELAIVKHKNNNHAEPVKQPGATPFLQAKDSVTVASNGYNADTSPVKQPLIIVKTSQPEPTAKKKGKFLFALAKITCKGLHKVTGQHIELEEHYAADTTTVIAYQLDLGNKKFQFPVRE